ncbi:cell surface protein [Paraburkholderia caribensis MBA4]|uniref:Cell surface protein n=1 Tax=Paraburkholderia caribensis MBA4 TaxID=1323664 RepID=A0A0P0R7Z1_9BURK|nr:cell surface protein [Paraburkholderia caribensis MBA4]
MAKGTDGTIVDFKGTAGSRKLTGVANGDVNASSVDAVNGAQLFNVAQSAADALGGGSTVNSDGTISNGRLSAVFIRAASFKTKRAPSGARLVCMSASLRCRAPLFGARWIANAARHAPHDVS